MSNAKPMTTFTREFNYTPDYGDVHPPLTSKQRRRIIHKANRMLGKEVKRNLRRHVTSTKELLKSGTKPCPICGVTGDPRDIPCITKTNKPASRPHKGRV